MSETKNRNVSATNVPALFLQLHMLAFKHCNHSLVQRNTTQFKN